MAASGTHANVSRRLGVNQCCALCMGHTVDGANTLRSAASGFLRPRESSQAPSLPEAKAAADDKVD